MKLFERTNIPLLNKALDAYALRQKVSAANMANVTTVGYRSQSVSFEEHLAAATDGSVVQGVRTHVSHLPLGRHSAYNAGNVEAKAHETRDDKPVGYNETASGFNDVDIDYEMTNLVQNQIQFKFGSRFLGDTFRGIQKAIRGTLS